MRSTFFFFGSWLGFVGAVFLVSFLPSIVVGWPQYPSDPLGRAVLGLFGIQHTVFSFYYAAATALIGGFILMLPFLFRASVRTVSIFSLVIFFTPIVIMFLWIDPGWAINMFDEGLNFLMVSIVYPIALFVLYGLRKFFKLETFFSGLVFGIVPAWLHTSDGIYLIAFYALLVVGFGILLYHKRRASRIQKVGA